MAREPPRQRGDLEVAAQWIPGNVSPRGASVRALSGTAPVEEEWGVNGEMLRGKVSIG